MIPKVKKPKEEKQIEKKMLLFGGLNCNSLAVSVPGTGSESTMHLLGIVYVFASKNLSVIFPQQDNLIDYTTR